MNKLNHFLQRQNWKQLFGLFLLIWIVINFIQVIFTEVMNDEAYYSMYGENLAWGYYDHPPMVGLMTYISGILFGGNMSVRFMTVLFQFFTLILIWKIIEEKAPDSKKIVLFFIISASMIMFTAYGFITAPDVPFLFFTALFLLIYKKYLEKDSWTTTLLLGIAMAGMVYSKYHAALIILLIVISNPRLLAKYKSWIALIFAIILLIPHIYWQISNDFPSFQYHLIARSTSFKWSYFFEYLPNQLVVFNPLTLGGFIYILIKYPAKDIFERGLYFLSIGFLIFFWLMAFRGHIEPHWTVACTIPMIILIYQHTLHDKKLLRFVKNWVTPSLLLILVARIVLLTDLLPERIGFNGKKKKDLSIEQIAGDLPVVYTGSFQKASTYHFFTKNESFVLSGVDSRLTQFDIWQKELDYQGKPAFIFKELPGKSTLYTVNGYSFHGYKAKSFQSVNRIKINYRIDEKEVTPGDTILINFEISNPTDFDVDFHHAEFPVNFMSAYGNHQSMNFANCFLEKDIDVLPAKSSLSASLYTIVPDIPTDDYRFTITLYNTLCPAVNAAYTSLKVK